ncbi:YhaN family protein [Labrys wisconsinensis]|uniref:Uncharacterized protein YhaN n=1 Tax=Labrys wisconsinensis TaxID=425677 RepID=A0ABU0J1R1_9HYPH|nr:YhaN family protein [Labrys wisconsinensis]MDQ0468189.1 uncharacterized protein YhaN [Labrys wisconsinensis]
MRLLRLDLERYGPFTDRTLHFRADAALHLVHGRNEAGKSSALAAITDLLYGFELRSSADFLHKYSELRVGAEILAADGRRLAVRRRKGNRNTLVDAQERPLDEALLEPLLGGVPREVFRTAFGLSQEGLRAGAQALIEARGDIGESLFAASSGLRGLVGVRAGLDDEADALFGLRRSDRKPFYQALERYDQARKDLREQTLRADELKALDDDIARHDERLAAIVARLGAVAGERARLARVRRVAPILRRIEAGLAEDAGLGPALAVESGAAPPVAGGFIDRTRAALDAAERGTDEAGRLEREAAAAAEGLADLAVDPPVLAEAAAVAALSDERAALAKALQDLPRRRGEARGIADEVADLARRLGLPDRAGLERLLPDDLAVERVRLLAERRQGFEAALAGTRKAAEAAAAEIAELGGQRARLAAAHDPAPLRRTLQAMRPALAAAAATQERRVEMMRRRRLLDERVARLAVADPGLWHAPLPDEETLLRFAARFAATASGRSSLEAEGRRQAAAVADAEQAAAALAGGDIVEAGQLAEARARRDAGFEAVLADPEPAAVTQYRGAVAQADHLADRRFAAADRIARHEAAQRSVEAARAALAGHATAVAAAAAEARALAAEWAGLFEAFAAAPPPERAVAWAGELRMLRQERDGIAELGDAVAAAEARLAAERPALDALAGQLGLADPANRSPETLVREIEERLDALEATARAARSLADQAVRAEAAQERAAAAAAEATAALAAFEPAWRTGLAGIGLAEAAGPGEVRLALDLWQKAAGRLVLLRDLEHRIATIEADAEGFARRAQGLAARLGLDAGAPAGLAEALAARLQRARDALARRRAGEEQQEKLRLALEAARRAGAAAQETLAALAGEAGVAVPELADLAARLSRRLALQAALAADRAELAQQGDGLAEAVLRAEAGGIEPVEAAAADAALAAEEAALQDERTGLVGESRDLKRRREALETASGAATAAQRREDAAADLERIARDYLALRTASALIAIGIERQRERQQDPLIARAGELLSRLTEAGFAGLAVDYGEDDRPRLAARRADGRAVAVDGLSEGTRDQLYLALRLASLETFAGRRPAPPFIGDDLVVTFDEGRVAAALAALAEVGGGVQTILFTHHRHVVEIARDRLGHNVDVIPLGNVAAVQG